MYSGSPLARLSRIPSDVQEFLGDYPDMENNNPNLNANVEFYSNLLPCQPDELLIDDVHEIWNGDYTMLERNHGYIQWLFPIQEYGMNHLSQPLQRHEILKMRKSPQILRRLLTSYELMLDFYGLRLIDEATGLIGRSLPPKDSPKRFQHLNSSFHNYLRITRILKCLSEMGLERLNSAFLLGILNYQSEFKELQGRHLVNSMDHWWANCIRDEKERVFVGERISEVRKGEKIWTRELYEIALEHRKENGRF